MGGDQKWRGQHLSQEDCEQPYWLSRPQCASPSSGAGVGVELHVVQFLMPQLLLLCSPHLKPRVSVVAALGAAFGLPKIGGAILDTAVC